MANQLPMSWVTATLEATTTRFLKKWIGLADQQIPPGSTFQKKGGLGLPAISTVYQKQQRSFASLIPTSCDPVVQHITHLAIKQNLHRPIYRPTLEVRAIWQKDPAPIGTPSQEGENSVSQRKDWSMQGVYNTEDS